MRFYHRKKVYQYKTKPRSYQVRALKKAVTQGKLGLWMPMRSGKSKVAIDWSSILHLKYGIRRVLILTHTPTTFGVWTSEIEKHCPLPHSVGVQEVPEGGESLEFLVLNIQHIYERERVDGGWEPAKNRWLREWNPEAVIVDESTAVGDPGSIQTAYLYRLVKDLGTRFILELTGTPAHRQIWGVFGQFKILNEDVFGTSIVAYREQYGVWGGFGGKKLKRLRNMVMWRKKVAPWVFQMRRVPSRPPIDQVIPIDLSPRAWAIHDSMAQEGVALDVEAAAPIVKILKCAQIAGGWLHDTENKHWLPTGTDLRRTFSDLVSDLFASEVRKIVVFARHLPELRDAAEELHEAGYKVLVLYGRTSGDAERRIAAFHGAQSPTAFVAQIATGSMGIDLSCADTTIFYTLTESLLHYDQAKARTRKHADQRALTYYYLLPKGTHLETMYLALQNKMNLADFVTKHPDLVSHVEEE